MQVQLQSLMKDALQTAKPVSLKEGQMVYGRIEKFLPDNTAIVQIGNTKVIAQVEANMSAGQPYLFHVKSTDGTVMLTLIDEFAKQMDTQQAVPKNVILEKILQSLNLDNTKNNREAVKFLMQEQLPVIKEDIQLALTTAGKNINDALQAMKQIYTLRLPFTSDIFQAMQSFQSPETLTSLIEKGSNALQNMPSLVENNESVKQLVEMLNTLKGDNTSKTTLSLLQTWLASNDKSSETAFSLLQKAGIVANESQEKVVQQLMDNILETAEEVKMVQNNGTKQTTEELKTFIKQTNLEEAKQLTKTVLEEAKQLTKTSLAETPNIQKNISEAIQTALKSAQLAKDTPLTTEEVKEIVHQTFTNVLKELNIPDKHLRHLFQSPNLDIKSNSEAFQKIIQMNKLPKEEREMLTSLMNGVSLDKPDEVVTMLKQVSRSLGLQYEHDVARGEKQPTDQLKPLLMKTLQESLPQTVRDPLESMVHRITAQQLLSQEQGPLQSIVMQIPANSPELRSDITVQWQGRKKENGQIDPNYCRVLFYLELETLKETIIDMQVQNRVMNVNVVNDTPGLSGIVQSLQPLLKENLAEQDYRLSSVRVTPSKEKEKSLPPLTPQLASEERYEGVDFRV